MDENVMPYDAKIKRILEKFLQPDYKLKSDTYLNSFLIYLKGNTETPSEKLVSHQIFPQWIIHATSTWETTSNRPNPTILSFALNLTSILASDEATFHKLYEENTFDRLLNIAKSDQTPTVKLACIKLLQACLQHSSGLLWVLSTNYWMDVLKLSLDNQTIYITKDGHNFISNLLERTDSVDNNFCANLLKVLLNPLSETAFRSIKNKGGTVTEISDDEIHKRLTPTLTLLTNILEYLLQNISTTKKFNIILILKNQLGLEHCIHNYLMIAQSSEFIFELNKVLFILTFFDLVYNDENEQRCNFATKQLYSIFKSSASRGLVVNVLNFCYLGYIYYKHVKTFVPDCALSLERCVQDAENTTLFENQLTTLQVLPICMISFKLIGPKELEGNADEFREEFVNKFFNLISMPTWRLAYIYKDGLQNSPLLFQNAALAIQHLLKSKKFYTRDIGALVFQCMMYCLKDISDVLKEHPEVFTIISKESNFTMLLLESIAVFIEEFQLSWRDSVETICVMNVAFDFLSIPGWPSQLVVKALKLVDISISKYMSPNLALLIDRTNDSTMAFIGPLLYAKLHDSSWEVRDSALEVLCTISHNAKTKFPSFQKIILDSQLPSLVVKIALRDGEGFVRATAIKCLQEMSQVNDFWNNILQTHDLNTLTMDILQNETEGIVRKEAATLMATLYEYKLFKSEMLPKVYDIMTHAVIADFHWEVKTNALTFWDLVIKNHLRQQGMIDGSFPTVVFSKEHRKIVTLTEIEVKKRLIKVLLQLNDVGCLSVLMLAVQDDCDLEVSKCATKITENLVDLLKKYKVSADDASLSVPSTPTSPLMRDEYGIPICSTSSSSSIVPDSQYCSMSSPFSSCTNDSVVEMNDSVLDEIINSSDANLLTGVYNPDDQISNRNFIPLKCKQKIPLYDFLKFVEQDLESRLNVKQEWLKNIDEFGSLLDDILKDYDDNDINSMDCY